MKAHNNGRANRLAAERWRYACKYYRRKSGCIAGYKHCNPHTCLKYKEKHFDKLSKNKKDKISYPWINDDEQSHMQ